MRRTRVRQKVWPVRHRTTITRRSFANELDWAAGPADRTDSARSMVAGSVRRTGGVSEKLQVRDGWLECRRPSGSRHECARHARTLSCAGKSVLDVNCARRRPKNGMGTCRESVVQYV